MRSIVTGGAGFIGSNISSKLLELGHEVICIDNESSDGHIHFYWNTHCKNYKLNICNYTSIEPLFKDVDYVFHLAAEARIMNCIENPTLAVESNVLGTANVLQASRINGVKKVIYSSTSSAYGNNLLPNKESQPDDCLNPYSISKVAGEKLCSMYTNLYGLKTIVFRYFNIYGHNQPIKGQYAPVLGIFLRQKANREPLTVVGDGSQRRDFTNVIDVVDANVLAATKDLNDSSYGCVYNIGTGTNYSILEIAKIISENYIFIDSRPGEMKETLADVSLAKEVFDWTPKIDFKKWLTDQL